MQDINKREYIREKEKEKSNNKHWRFVSRFDKLAPHPHPTMKNFHYNTIPQINSVTQPYKLPHSFP